jgi:hypothetical protein
MLAANFEHEPHLSSPSVSRDKLAAATGLSATRIFRRQILQSTRGERNGHRDQMTCPLPINKSAARRFAADFCAAELDAMHSG